MSDASALIEELSNFYNTYGYEEEFIPGLFQCYLDSFEMLENYLKQIESNINSSECETFRTIPYASTETNMWEYTIETLVISSKFPEYTDMSNAQFLWDNMTADEKVPILDDLGRYIELQLATGINNTNAKAIDLKLYDYDDSLLIKNIDYKLSNNKIYPINQYVSMPNEKVILKDIIVDFGYIFKRTGVFINKEYESVMSKQEYRDTNVAFMEAAGKGPTTVNLDKSLSSMFYDDSFDIIDIGSADLRKKFLWETGVISPFDFVINIPATYSEDPDRVDLFAEYIHIVKPSDTNYIMNWVINAGDNDGVDIIDISDNIDDGIKAGLGITDTIPTTDNVSTNIVQNEYNFLLFSELSSLDSTQYSTMDSDNIYFDIVISENPRGSIYYDYADTLLDNNRLYDIAPVEKIICDDIISSPSIIYKMFPEYPLDFSVTTGSGYAIISFKNNSINCTGYRLIRDNIQVLDIVPDEMGAGETIVYNDIISGSHEYQIKSYYKPFSTSDDRLEYSISPKKITVVV